jgi:hypothetical protein
VDEQTTKIINTLSDDSIPNITMQVTEGTVLSAVNIPAGISALHMVAFAASLTQAYRNMFGQLYEIAHEASGISRDWFAKAIKDCFEPEPIEPPGDDPPVRE